MIALWLTTLTALSSQSRATVEAQRMDLLQEIERAENSLGSISAQKQSMLKKIDQLALTSATDNVSSITEEEPEEEPAVEPPASDLERLASEGSGAPMETEPSAVLQRVHNHLLRAKVRHQLLSPEGYKSPEALEISLVRDRQISQLRSRLESIERTSFQQEAPILLVETASVETPSPPDPAISATEDNNIDGLTASVSELIDREATMERDLKRKLAELERLNLQLDALLRKGQTAQTAQTIQGPAPLSGSSLIRKRGFLPWPVSDPVVTARYDEDSQSMTMKSSDKKVQCIYGGTVASIITEARSGTTVTISHDHSYTTTYKGLAFAIVTEGQTITDRELLGEHRGSLEIQIWENSIPQNPIHWLKNN